MFESNAADCIFLFKFEFFFIKALSLLQWGTQQPHINQIDT